MKQLGTKIKLIYFPLVIIAFATICIYTFLHWMLFIESDQFKVDDDVLNLFVPMVAPIIPLLIWLRPRIKLLNLNNRKRRGDPLLGILVFAWAAILAPLCISQSYLESATGKLTPLDRISQIDSVTKSKYYTLQHYFINKALARSKTTFGVSNKNNDFDMTIYVTLPITNKGYAVDTSLRPFKLPLSGKQPLVIIDGKRLPESLYYRLTPENITSIRVLKPPAA